MIMFLSKNWNFNKMSPKYPLESLENRARRGKIYMYLLKKCETKAEDQWRRANTGIVCVFQCIPHQCQASKSGFLAEFLTVPSCSNKNSKLFPSPTCMPDLEMKNAKLRARPCMYASATAEMPGCSKPGKQYGSNIPQDHWKTKPSTSAERERSIEKYYDYYAITMPLLFLIPAIDPLDIWTIESRSLMIGLTTTIWGQCVIESWHRQAGAKFFTTVPEESWRILKMLFRCCLYVAFVSMLSTLSRFSLKYCGMSFFESISLQLRRSVWHVSGAVIPGGGLWHGPHFEGSWQ